MSLYSIEAFSRSYDFHAAAMMNITDIEDDYVSISSIKFRVPVPNWPAQRNDFIRLQNNDNEVWGIISKIGYDAEYTDITMKSLMSLADVTTSYPEMEDSIESWISDILLGLYSINVDDFQNVVGFSTEKITRTTGIINLENSVVNLYENILLQAFKNYGIVCKFAVDIKHKKLNVAIGQQSDEEKIIETDLGNLSAKLILKNSDDSANKIIVHKEDMSESITYYLQDNGVITDSPDQTKRITPVIFEAVVVKYNESKQTFADAAYAEAFSKLKKEILNHLIELECMENDQLVEPVTMKIGQNVTIIIAGVEYHTMLTGKKIKNGKVILSFGCVRLELTKKLKGWRNK